MKKFIITAFVLMFIAGQSFAFNYSMYDFGESNIFDHNNNWAPIDYPFGIGHQPSPGNYNPGGEYFDLEGLNVAADQDYIYVSLTNSFGYEQEGFRLGDLFIGVGTNKYQYAVDLQMNGANGGLYEVDTWNYIQRRSDSYYSYSRIREAAGAHELASGNYLGGVNSMMTFEEDLETDFMSNGDGDTYVWELRLDRSMINGGDLSNLSFHVNVGCGNDLMETGFNGTPSVPEPGTLLLFGLGLLGSAAYRRKKS